MVKIILIAILIYLAYQFIFNFLVPVYLTSRKIKKGFREMHQRMEEQYKATQGQNSQSTTSPDTEKKKYQPKKDDYIEFEEL